MHASLNVLLISNDPELSERITDTMQSEACRVTVASVANRIPLSALAASDAVLVDVGRRPNGEESFLHDCVAQLGPDRVWLLTPLGAHSWDEQRVNIAPSHRLFKPLQRHDLERILEAITASGPREKKVSAGALTLPSMLSHAGSSDRILEELPGGRYFLADSTAMSKIYETVRLLAPVDVPVLILGESGVGKDIIANLLHMHSMRAQHPFVSVNCAALPSELLESELFGYEAGAFTGAVKPKPGKFEIANGGSILLDEIGEMSAAMQAKLLHVLQDGRFSRLGSRTSSQVEVRVLAATNVDIEHAIAEKTFREDLYYRISAFVIKVPPLRERKEEIPALVSEMLARQAAAFRKDPVFVSPSLMSLLQEYDWPGNLRELFNVVVRMEVLQNTDAVYGEITQKIRNRVATDTSFFRSTPADGEDSMRSLVRQAKDETEKKLIQVALNEAGWNRRHACQKLGISYRGLLYKIQQYGLREPQRSFKPQSVDHRVRLV